MPKPDLDTARKENYRSMFLMNVDVKNPQQNTTKLNPTAH